MKIDKNILNSICSFVRTYEEGLLLVSEENQAILFINDVACRMLNIKEKSVFVEVLNGEEQEKLRANGVLSKYVNGQTVKFVVEKKKLERYG